AVAAAEDLVAVARRVEEVDRAASGDAVAGRPDVDGYVVHGEDVAGPENLVPVVEEETEVVQLPVGTLHDGEAMRGLHAVEPGSDQFGIGGGGGGPVPGPGIEARRAEPV